MFLARSRTLRAVIHITARSCHYPPVMRVARLIRGVVSAGVVAVTAVAVASVAGVPASATSGTGQSPAREFSAVHWSYSSPARGVVVESGTLSDPPAAGHWTVTVTAPARNRLTGAATTAEVGPRRWASRTEAALRARGWAPRVTAVQWPDYADTPHGIMGYRVRVGAFSAQAAAESEATQLRGEGFATAVEWTGYDADQPLDAESFHVAIIDPTRFPGAVVGSHDGSLAQRRTTSTVARQNRAVVATNGGFFVISDTAGFPGVPTGAAAYGDTLESMANGDRAALLLQHGRASIANVTTTVSITANGAGAAVEGINRKPGVIPDCGRPNAVPTTAPRQDVVCTATNDMVLFTPQLGAVTPSGPGAQAVLDGNGRVISFGARGGGVPPGDVVLQGIGQDADWLTRHAGVGTLARISEHVQDAATGRAVALGSMTSMVSAAPILVRNGKDAIDAATEGVVDPTDLSFGYAWANDRQPRTMAGVDSKGELILATVDGRDPGVSEGLTLAEEADFMRQLGAANAMNLDGGGSTTWVINGRLVNRPSDPTGERAVGDVVMAAPARP